AGLLVLRAGDGVRRIVDEAHPPVRTPAEAVEERGLAPVSEDHRIVPVEDVDPERAAAVGEGVEELPDGQRRTPAFEAERRAAVEVPGQDGDRLLGPLGGPAAAERVEVRGAVDEQGDASRAGLGAAVPAPPQEALSLPSIRHGATRRRTATLE